MMPKDSGIASYQNGQKTANNVLQIQGHQLSFPQDIIYTQSQVPSLIRANLPIFSRMLESNYPFSSMI